MKQSTGHLKLLALLLTLISLAFVVRVERSALAQTTSDKETIKKSGEKIETPPAAGAPRQITPGSASSISEKNIFSPARRDFPVQPELKPVVRPQIILYGVTIAGDYQAASIANPGRTLHRGEREIITLRVGEQIGGYKLAKISPDRILMEGPEDSFEVFLYDSRSAKRRSDVKTDNQQAAVTNPFTVESKEPRVTTPQRVATPEKMTPVPFQQESMPAPSVFAPPMSPTPVSPESIPTPTVMTPPTMPAPTTPIQRRRFYRGGTIAPSVPTPTN